MTGIRKVLINSQLIDYPHWISTLWITDILQPYCGKGLNKFLVVNHFQHLLVISII